MKHYFWRKYFPINLSCKFSILLKNSKLKSKWMGYTPLYQSPVIPIGTMSPNFQTLFQPPIVPIGTTGPMFLEKITNTYFFVKCLFSVWFFHYVIICNGMCYILSPVFDIVFSDNYRACCTRLNRSCLTGLLITNIPPRACLTLWISK